MIKTRLCETLGIKHPIIQAGMGPFGTNKLCIAAADAGALGLISSSALEAKELSKEGYEQFKKTFEPGLEDDSAAETLKNIFRHTLKRTEKSKGVFGLNALVSAEILKGAIEMVKATLEVREESPEMKDRLRVIVTSAGNPKPFSDLIKPSGVKWFHVVPSVKAAQKAVEAGCDGIVASGHEGGFHTAWEPIHSMILLPAVAEEFPDHPVVGAGGFCDGKTLAAALVLGGAGIQMGTRFLCTQESDFVALWKNRILEAGDRGTLVARGLVGPARYVKSSFSVEMAEETAKHSPGVYTGRPDDISTVSPELLLKEIAGFNASYEDDPDEAKALTAGGECAQRIKDMPSVKELVDRIMQEAEDALSAVPAKVIASV
jgi:NAD(P)H-dependent flavin oxidoreductase YrpB (nitropropane dioxygenase family)